MIDQPSETLTQTLLRDGREVTIRRLAEDDRAALLAFGAALPEDDRLYLEDDLQSQEIITRLVNAHAAENWRQIVALVDEQMWATGRCGGWRAGRTMWPRFS